ncbi:hypothetical protein [Pseudaminobacter salicylatoxidans]|uniref:hypothetical protein n=1 Tax=Pseudaminobacter salicylatoxidans TaxID=93369 RepID=UPI0011B2815C|nr:hypothetical protein [Pseudaminobacter salicylatoxidans]
MFLNLDPASCRQQPNTFDVDGSSPPGVVAWAAVPVYFVAIIIEAVRRHVRSVSRLRDEVERSRETERDCDALRASR